MLRLLTFILQNVIPPSLAKKACQKSCTLGPLKVREAEIEAADEDDNADDAFDAVDFDQFSTLTGDDESTGSGALQAREPITGAQVCKAACAVTCNSTVLALRQKWCLEKCVGLIMPVSWKMR